MRGPKLSAAQERDRNALREGLRELLPTATLRDFDDERFVGSHDDASGVQWHVSVDRSDLARWLAVNLEGLAYKDWPIARFITREMESPELPLLASQVDDANLVFVHLTRDAWSGPRTRVAVEQWSLLPRRALSLLTATVWQRAVGAARGCLAAPGGGRGTATLTRVKNHLRDEFEVSPHLNVGVVLQARGTQLERLRELQKAQAQLQPIYEFFVRRCSMASYNEAGDNRTEG
jgi:hypothetical protein